MRKYLCLLIIAHCCLLNAVDAQTTGLQPGMVIRQSVTIAPASYTLNAEQGITKAVIEISGENIVVDFSNSILQGSNDRSRPDEFYGLAIRVAKGSKNITIKNLSVHGYKIAILADSVDQLTIDHCDLSYNWRQHLQSNLDREDISDWMSYHHNENSEWLRYGAGIYLVNCNAAVITNNTITGGQCGLMMTRCNIGTVADNNFSFNSGIGIGMYRSSHNKVYHNRLDYNVRGYSDGKYKRGQDSAAILVFEQSSENIFAYNSATHSGDGFFLWAGQTTMDTGIGGCNDNLIYGNDFSYAPTNGVEVTFSRNLIIKNRITDCDHGVWGGYSYESDITDNIFARNRIGIAIEHGQAMNIFTNSFTGDKTGVKLWSRETQPADWAYARVRNTESRNYWITANRFTDVGLAFDIMGTDTVILYGNSTLNVGEHLKLGDRIDNIDTAHEGDLPDMDYQRDERLKTIPATERPAMQVPAGKQEMRITPWGPYDFRYPLLWLKQIDSAGIYHFEVLGPGGRWQIADKSGYEILSSSGDSFPAQLTARPVNDDVAKHIELNYNGQPFTDQFGKQQPVNTTFSYNSFKPQMNWNVSWYKWDPAHKPADGFSNFENVFTVAPFFITTTDKIDYTWWGAVGKNLPADSFATVATTKVSLPAGRYAIGITADDYAKVFVDGKEMIDAWDAAFTALDETTHHRKTITLSEGVHEIRIVHAEVGGLASLMFYLDVESYR